MTDKEINPREPLRSILLGQRQECEKSLSFYKELEEKMSEEDLWKIKKKSPFLDELKGLVYAETQSPVTLFETAIHTIDEYLTAIDNFTDDQLAAFFLGLGLTWLPVRYWGTQELYDYYAKIQKALVFYEQLLAKIPEEDHWKIKKSGIFSIPDLVVPDNEAPTKMLEQARGLVESMLAVLSDRPF